MSLGLGPFTPPQEQPAFTPSGNPIWDEIQQAHGSLSPAAQRAVAMSGVPQRAAEAEAGPLGGQPAEAPPQAPRPIASPSSLNVRGLGSPAASPASATPIASPEAAHLGELNRVTAPPMAATNPLAHTKADTGRSGIGQIHNPFLRGLATVGDAVGSAVLPNVLRFVPGTELHHRDVVSDAEGVVNADVARAKSGAETSEANARAESLTNPKEAIKTPFEAWWSTNKGVKQPEDWLKTEEAAKYHAPNEYADFKQGYAQSHPDATPDQIVSAFAAKPTAATAAPHFVHMPGVGVVSLSHGADGKVASDLVYKEDPKIETDLTDLDVGGIPHKVIVNKQTGKVIQDLGKSGIKPPVVNVNAEANRSDHSYDKRNAELTAIGKPVTDMMGRFGRLQDTIAAGTPQADALVAPELLTVMAGGAGSGLRMNEAEIARIVGGRSHWENLRGAIQKWSLDPKSANSITPEQRQQIRSLVSAVGDKLAKKQQILNESYSALAATDDEKEHRNIVNKARSRFSEIDGGGESEGTINVQLPDGRIGPIHPSQKGQFLKDNPGSKVVR